MFCRNHKFTCAANFVGSGDYDDVNDCLAYLASQGKKFNITVEYHTVRAYYPGSPVCRQRSLGGGIRAFKPKYTTFFDAAGCPLG